MIDLYQKLLIEHQIEFSFLFGLFTGSFLNVCIARMPHDLSVVKPRSNCPNCKYMIPWYLNIPVFAYIFLRGKCANCSQKISLQYPLVEIITATLFAFTAWHFQDPIELPFYFFFMSTMVIATFIDLEHWIIPDKITLLGIPVGIVAAFFVSEISWIESLIGVLLGGGSIYLMAFLYEYFAKQEGIGGGDLKFLAMGGAFVGPKGVMITLIVSSILGALIGVALMIITGKGSKTAIPFGPFLALGLILSLLYREQIWRWYIHIG